MSRQETSRAASLAVSTGNGGVLTLRLSGWFDARTISDVWRECRAAVNRSSPAGIIVDGADIQYCDGAGIAMLVDLQREQAS